jgi:hypothetical protein
MRVVTATGGTGFSLGVRRNGAGVKKAALVQTAGRFF